MIIIVKYDETVTNKKPPVYMYTIVNNVPGVLLSHTKAEKNKHENFNFVIVLPSSNSFFFTCTSSTTGEVLFLS